MSTRTHDFVIDGEVAAAFWACQSRVQAIRGPFGSGKSVVSAHKVMKLAAEQKPDRNNVRHTRWAIVRNTFPELKTTTVKTWRDWFTDDYGRFKWNTPYTHEIYVVLPDRTAISAEIWFIALDRPGDVKKLLSLELTGAWVNEARQIDKSLIDTIDGRIARYPSVGMVEGGCTRPALLLDTNAMPQDHWWPIMSGETPPPEYMTQEERDALVKPPGWSFFTQPPALLENRDERGRVTGYRVNPKRENKRGLPDSYYLEQVPGKTTSYIRVFLMNQLASIFDGKLVYPTYNANAHKARAPIERIQGQIYVGIDFGRTPAAVFGQMQPGGGWNVLLEVYGAGMGARRFAQFMLREIARKGWSDANFRFFGDPAGDDMAQTDDESPFQVMRAAGIPVIPAPGQNDLIIRIEAVEQLLDRLSQGRPALQIDPGCVNLITGFEGGYHYPKIGMVNGAESHDDKPLKNRFSHFQDALQYMVLGGGEGRVVIGGSRDAKKAIVAKRAGSPMARLRENRSRQSWRRR